MKLVGLIIAEAVLNIIPVWFLNFFDATFITKLLTSLLLGLLIWFFVDKRSTA